MGDLNLGEKIRMLRKRQGITQQELAGNEFTKSFVSQVEKGMTRPSLKTLQIMANRLGKPVSYFLGEDHAGEPTEDSAQVDRLSALGASHEEKGEWAEALQAYDDALHHCGTQDVLRRGRLYSAKARVYYKRQMASQAVGALEMAIDCYRSLGDAIGRAHAYNLIAAVRSELEGAPDRAIESLEKGLFLIDEEHVDDPALEVRVLTNLAINTARVGRLDDALRYCTRAQDRSKRSGYYYRFGMIVQTLGYVYRQQGELDRAVDATDRALEFYRSVEDLEGEIGAFINKGVLYRQSGERERAQQALDEAFHRIDRLPAVLDTRSRKTLESAGREELALLAEARGDAKEAVTEMERAIRTQIDPVKKGMLHRAAARIQREGLEAAPEARVHLEKAVKLLAKEDAPRDLADVYSELSDVLQALDENEKATEYLSKSVSLFRDLS